MKYKTVKRDNYKIQVYNLPGKDSKLMNFCESSSCR